MCFPALAFLSRESGSYSSRLEAKDQISKIKEHRKQGPLLPMVFLASEIRLWALQRHPASSCVLQDSGYYAVTGKGQLWSSPSGRLCASWGSLLNDELCSEIEESSGC